MPWWAILHLAGYVFVGAVVVAAGGWWAVRLARGWAYDWRHAKHLIGEVQRADWGAGYERGSMILAEEQADRSPFPPPGEWNDSTTESNGAWEHRDELWNGHTLTCLRPGEEHLGACPEEGDWPDDHDWPLPVPDLPDMLPAAPVPDRPSLVDTALASAAEDPADAGWTDQFLADLRDAPTALDGVGGAVTMIATNADAGGLCACSYGGLPCWNGGEPYICGECADGLHWHAQPESHERLADTGEIHLASLRADWVADLDAQDDDAAEFCSRLASEAAEIRLSVHGL